MAPQPSVKKGKNNINANEETGEDFNVNPSNAIASTAKEVDVTNENEKENEDENICDG